MRRPRPFITVLLLLAACASPDGPGVAPGESATSASTLERRYEDGEVFRYVMTGTNQHGERTRSYSAECEVHVVRGEDGVFREEVRWTRLEVDGREVELGTAGGEDRAPHQVLSLDPAFTLTLPALAGVPPFLIGPILDLMTIYVDLHRNLHQGRLQRSGDHAFVPHGAPNSWADGTRIVLGQDCIDFDLTLERADPSGAELVVRHVPPERSSVQLPAAWMQEPVGARPNNWVQATKVSEGEAPSYVAAVGQESFEVRIVVAAPSNRIVRATLDNPVDVVERRCSDLAFTECDEAVRYRIQRVIELRAVE